MKRRKKLKRSKRLMVYHGRRGHPVIHRDGRRTFVMVRKKGGGTRRLYKYQKYMR